MPSIGKILNKKLALLMQSMLNPVRNVLENHIQVYSYIVSTPSVPLQYLINQNIIRVHIAYLFKLSRDLEGQKMLKIQLVLRDVLRLCQTLFTYF